MATDRIVLKKDGPHYYLGTREVTEAEYREVYPLPKAGDGSASFSQSKTGWPIVSDALAVHPSDIGEATEDAKRRGVPTHFLPDGRPILTDREHRRRYNRAYGFRDNRGGYGD